MGQGSHSAGDAPRSIFSSGWTLPSHALARELQPIPTFSVGMRKKNTANCKKQGKWQSTWKRIITKHYHPRVPRVLPKLVQIDEPVATRSHLLFVAFARGESNLRGGQMKSSERCELLEPSSWLGGTCLPRRPFLLEVIPPGIPGKLLNSTPPLEERFLGNAKIFPLRKRNR